MKKIYNKANRSFRKFFSRLFSSLIKRHNHNYQTEIKKIIEMLQDIQDSIEIMARQMARQIKSGE
jgi:hypothetical protein